MAYPGLHENSVKVHPRAGNIAKQCKFCHCKPSTKDGFWLVKEHDGYHIMCSIELTAASLISDEDEYVIAKSDVIKACPFCCRKLSY